MVIVLLVVVWCGVAMGGGKQASVDESLRDCAGTDERAAMAACERAVDAKFWETGTALPAATAFYERMGRVLEARRQWEAVIRLYRESVQRFPEHAQLHYRYGDVLLRQLGAYEEAFGPLSEAVRRDPKRLDARVGLADAMRLMGRVDDAIREYRVVLTTRPSDIRAREGLGLAFVKAKRYADAVRELQRAVTAEADNTDLKIELAQALRLAGSAQQSLDVLNDVLGDAGANRREAHCEMSHTLRALGRDAEAGEACRQAQRSPASQHGASCTCGP